MLAAGLDHCDRELFAASPKSQAYNKGKIYPQRIEEEFEEVSRVEVSNLIVWKTFK